jgi:hypothetical protein
MSKRFQNEYRLYQFSITVLTVPKPYHPTPLPELPQV